MKKFISAITIILCCWLYASSSHAAVLVIDSFVDLGGPFFAPISQSTTNAVGGIRDIQRVAGTGGVTIGQDTISTPGGFSQTALVLGGFISPATARVTYGINNDLNLNFLRYTDQGDPNSIFIRLFSRSDDDQQNLGLTNIRLRLFDGSNNHMISQNIGFVGANNIGNLVEWNVNDYALAGLNITTIQRIEFEVDLVANGTFYLGLLSSGSIPEPGTMALYLLAFGLVAMARRKIVASSPSA